MERAAVAFHLVPHRGRPATRRTAAATAAAREIRRSSYHNVVKVSEIEDILDISDVQTYIINSARVVFLNERPQLRGSGVSICKGPSSSTHNCETCGRTLLDAFRFCSLGCNLVGIKEDVSMQSIVETGPLCGGKDDVTSIIDNVGSSTSGDKQDCCNDKNEEEPAPKRIARHRRKGIPQRAPFF